MVSSAKCLVVGGSGFLGSHLVDALLEAGHDVVVLDVQPLLDDRRKASASVAFQRGSFLRETDVQQAVRGCEFVFHFATTTIPKTSVREPLRDNENIVGTLTLLKACVEAGVRKLIFPSSGGTMYGEPEYVPIDERHPLKPQSPYAATKIAIENYLYSYNHLYGLDYCVLRYGNPYGPRQSPTGGMGIVSVFLGLVKKVQPPTLYGDGSAVRDFFYATDAARAAVTAMRPTRERIFNIASGTGTSIRDLVALLGEVTGQEIRPRFADPLPGDVRSNVLDISRARQELGWAPKVPLREGLSKTWEWIRKLEF